MHNGDCSGSRLIKLTVARRAVSGGWWPVRDPRETETRRAK